MTKDILSVLVDQQGRISSLPRSPGHTHTLVFELVCRRETPWKNYKGAEGASALLVVVWGTPVHVPSGANGSGPEQWGGGLPFIWCKQGAPTALL